MIAPDEVYNYENQIHDAGVYQDCFIKMFQKHKFKNKIPLKILNESTPGTEWIIAGAKRRVEIYSNYSVPRRKAQIQRSSEVGNPENYRL